MNRLTSRHWVVLLVANLLAWAVLGLYRPGTAAPPKVQEPFANAVEQRIEIINQLREISAQLKEQNALLRSGQMRVLVVSDQR